MDEKSLGQIEQIVTTAIGRETSVLRQEVDARLTEKFEEAERHSGVLYEDVLRRIDLVVEGYEGLRQGQAALRQTIENEFLKLQSLLKPS